MIRLSLSAIAIVAIAAPVAAQTAPSPTQQVQEVAARLEGTMNTSAQATANPKVANVYMTTCRIQVHGSPSGTVFLYQEQAIAKELNKPYRQRFLQLAFSAPSQTVRSLAFKPVSPSTWVNFCDKPATERQVQPQELGTSVCSVFLKQSGEDYVGNTPPTGCSANVRGAVKITNHIVLKKTGMQTWDRGFDANGKQVWGAKGESYQFRKL
ncbi:MAG TPA: chromophore lyase CpcT/CpeT [Thermosynechococcaceae cyanobacterium]|jgi:hypothetical protein